MVDYLKALGANGTDIFAGVAVSDFKSSLDWYTRLLGAPPAFFPNDREAVWMLREHLWLYIIVDHGRAGGGIQTIMCDDLESTIDAIEARGLSFDDEERPAHNVRKVMYRDPDGNEIGLGSIRQD